ncbi:GyrI-like domain-containing protein [Paenibacillus sp. sptzw28]|uniref:GyrI-like domain-containing protein n=1 Tax=Paenibacillus sp. sptzw28 TaxID=715179 RepID=UPI001C6EC0F9|nr:GyrI-like domain-containing protein [Paenibacillus sp. sptzw28]QYR21283.1 GyrI-like domain-containing protein [Paenibacillus sp. sptzw28]
MDAENRIELLEIPEIRLVGLSVTSSFKGHLPERVEAMKQEFYKRKGEIPNVIHPERYISPSFSSEVLFTYLICMEVEDLSEVPEGMIGFTIPPHRYAKTKSTGDPYQVIHDYLNTNGLQNDNRALALEIYYFDKPVWPDEAEVLIPLK